VIDIVVIPVTDEPMEGVAFDVQDHARRTGTIWTGTHREMISLDLHGVEEPTRWMLRPHQGGKDKAENDQTLHQRRRERSTRGTLGTAWPRGIDPCSEGRWL
jgi:hypothetical protein